MARGGKGTAIAAVGIGGGLLAMLALSRKSSAATETRSVSSNEARAVALSVKWAKQFGAPPSLLIALMKIESNYNPNAKNLKNARGGAWGLTQMTLATAQDLTKRFPAAAKQYWPGFNGTGPSLLDPDTNAAISAYHLGNIWKRYKGRPGNWLTAGLAWHQGSGNIDKQIAQGGGKVNPANLPPNGTTFYNWLKRELTSNPVVAKAITSEEQSGAFTYA